MENTFWVLESIRERGTLYYKGECESTTLIERAFKYWTKDLALEFLGRAQKDSRITEFKDYVATEYQVVYKKVT